MEQIGVAFYKGKKRIFNRLVSWWTKGPYSHCELVFCSDFTSSSVGYFMASSSFQDGGVRFKTIDASSENWDIVWLDVPFETFDNAMGWFVANHGKKYDVIGLFGFLFRPITGNKSKYFCSEAVASSLGIEESWRFDPNTLALFLRSKISQN